jgi:hypothetical protein
MQYNNGGLHISLLYNKFDYNISCLTLLIISETIFSIFSNSDLDLGPRGAGVVQKVCALQLLSRELLIKIHELYIT